jgi:hypothetical protein
MKAGHSRTASGEIRHSERLQTAMNRYFCGDFVSAVEQFEQVRAHDPIDHVPALFIERCTRYLRELPPSDWQGFERLARG